MEKTIIAQLSVQKKSIEQFMKIVKILVKDSNNEKGCLEYRLFHEVGKQNEFIFYEKYISKEAVTVHNTSEHLNTFLKAVSPMLKTSPKIEMY